MGRLSESYVVVLPDTSSFEPTLRNRLRKIDTGSMGRDAGGRFTSAFSEESARQSSRKSLFNAASLARQGTAAGLRVGGSLAKQIGQSMTGAITSRAGEALGNLLADKAAAKLRQTKLFSGFAANANKAGDTAGTGIASRLGRSLFSKLAPAATKAGGTAGSNIVKGVGARLKGPALLAAAATAGVLIGKRLGQSASGSANSSFKINMPSGKGLGSLTSGLGGLKAGIAGLVATLAGGAVVGGLKSLADEASDLNETVSKSRTIFGESSRALEAWAGGAARNLGMSRQEALSGASAFGNLFDQLKFGSAESLRMSKGFVQMATDAASFNNANPAEVMDAFLSATRGEYDALQKYIPTASAATIESEALRMTHKKSVGDLTAADKAAALYELSIKGLGKAQGDFKRTGDGYANQQRIFAANWADLRVKIGQYFLPIFNKATQYMNNEGFDALTRIVTALGDVGGAAGNMAKAVWSSLGGIFSEAVDNATLDLGELADWFSTHQTDMVQFFLTLGHGALDFGRTLTGLAAGGIRAFGNLSNGLADFIDGAIPALDGVLQGLAAAIGIFDKDAALAIVGASYKMRKGGEAASKGLRMTRDQAEAAARTVERTMYPAFDKAEKKLTETGKAEIWKAKQRDAAAAASNAIRDIGTKADGSQIKLKSWNDRTKLGSDAQKGLENRIKLARQRMIEQRETAIKAGATQSDLTRRWDKGREALYREFRQMGLSKDEAKRLTKEYGRIPKKSETKVSQPGMRDARRNAQGLDRDVNNLNSKGINVKVTYSASGTVNIGGGRPKTKVRDKNSTLGGQTRGSATGNFSVLPGYTPGRDVFRYRDMTGKGPDVALSGGEPIMRPEFGKVVGKGWIDGANKAARSGGVGGVRRFMGQQHFANGGVFRTINSQISQFGKTPDPSAAYETALAYARRAGESNARAAATRLAAAEVRRQKAAARAAARAASAAAVGGEKISGVGRGMRGVISIARKLGWGSGGSYPGHDPSQARARDFMRGGRSKAAGDKLASTLWANRKSLGLWYLVWWARIISQRKSGRWEPYRVAGQGPHKDHIHAAVFNKGGVFRPTAVPRLSKGGLVRGGRGGVLAHVGEGAQDELVTPLPRNWRSGGSNDRLDRLIEALEGQTANGQPVGGGAAGPVKISGRLDLGNGLEGYVTGVLTRETDRRNTAGANRANLVGVR